MARIRFISSVVLVGIPTLAACDSPQDSGVTTVTSTAPSTTTETWSTSTSSASSTAASSNSSSPSTTTVVTTGTTATTGTTSATDATSSTAVVSSSASDTSLGDSSAESVDTVQSDTTVSETTPPTDPCASVLLCDNFDDDTVGMAPGQPWKTETNENGGQVVISNERAFSGDKSVHVSNTQGQYKRAYFSVDGAPAFPGAGAELYGRLMMWVDTSPADGVHWTFIQGEGPSDDGSYDIFYRYGGQHQGKLMANFETQGVASDCWNHSATVMPTQTWACVEWRFNTATDEMQFWLDGTELDDLHVVGQGNEGSGCVADSWSKLWPAPQQFEVLRLGLEKYQEDGPLNLWIDDVAIGATRVGCPTAE